MSSKRSEGIGTDAEIVPFGTTSTGETVRLITLRLGGLTAKLSTYGATLTSLVTLDCRGELAETVLGFGVHEGYAACPYYFGCTVGRYANRIAGGAFPLGDGVVQLPNRNDRGNTLHGGLEGWDKRVWTVQDASRTACTLVLHSPDGDEGFPLALDATVRFSLEHGGR
jgi:aldose 1-epimerase